MHTYKHISFFKLEPLPAFAGAVKLFNDNEGPCFSGSYPLFRKTYFFRSNGLFVNTFHGYIQNTRHSSISDFFFGMNITGIKLDIVMRTQFIKPQSSAPQSFKLDAFSKQS